MLKSRNILLKTVKRISVLLVLFTITKVVFGVSGIGIKSNGGDEKNRTSAHQNFSNIKSSITFSLKTNVPFNSNVLNPNAEEKFVMYNSIVTYRKGSVTYVLPYKTRSIKLPGFISMGPVPTNR